MASKPLEIDFSRYGAHLPEWTREIIEAHLAIESERAQQAGAMGFMARAFVQAAMPYKNPKTDVYTRQNGDFKLRIVAGYDGGIPYGVYPRLLMSWITTEAVRTKSPDLVLGDSLADFLRDVLEIRDSGGARGSRTLVTEQMRRLFGSAVTATYTGSAKAPDGTEKRKFSLKNIQIADTYSEDEGDLDDALWDPQKREEAGAWRSSLRLTQPFFEECINSPIPIDRRAYKALRTSSMAMDIYTWITYRMSYLKQRAHIRWEALMMQFGSGFGGGVITQQSLRDFRKAFLHSMRMVMVVYSALKIEVDETGVILVPSAPHILPSRGTQIHLFQP